MEAAYVTGLGVGITQVLQLGGGLVVGRSNFLSHESIEPRPYGVGALHNRGKALFAQLCLVCLLCGRRFGFLFVSCFPSLDDFGGKIFAHNGLAGWDLVPWICEPV